MEREEKSTSSQKIMCTEGVAKLRGHYDIFFPANVDMEAMRNGWLCGWDRIISFHGVPPLTALFRPYLAEAHWSRHGHSAEMDMISFSRTSQSTGTCVRRWSNQLQLKC